MWSKAFNIRMLVLISLVLLTSMVNFGSCCCERKERITTFLDSAIDFISKVKSESIACEEEHNIRVKVLDCADLYRRGYNKSDVYTIHPNSRLTSITSLDVYCDMVTDGGGWTVIQRRGDFKRENNYFDKDWESYKKGFGNNKKDFWLGNDKIFAITQQKLYSVRFDMEDKQQNRRFAHYDTFWIDDEYNNYTLHISEYSGNAGDAMALHDEMKFTTKDRDNDLNRGNCGIKFNSGWWFNNCYYANLNGLYNSSTHGINWNKWKHQEHLPRAEIKIRPSNFRMI